MFNTLTFISLGGTLLVAAVLFILNRKLEEIKSSLSKKELIHKIQFEKEFEIYWSLWKKIGHLKITATLYFIILDFDSSEKSEFFDPFLEELENVYETIIIREPFLAEEVYKRTDKLTKISLEVLKKFKNPITANQSELRKIKDELFEICAEIEKAIRRRIIA